MKLWSSYASYFCFSFGWHLSISRSFFSWDHASPNLKGPPGYETIERRNGERRQSALVRLPNYLMASCSLFKRFAQSALVRLPNYLMASCSLLRFVRLTSAQVAYMDLRSASRSMSLHLSALAALSCTTSCSASRYMALHSANRFMSIQFIVSACRSCSTSLAVAPVASRTWFPYSSSRSIHMLTCTHGRKRSR